MTLTSMSGPFTTLKKLVSWKMITLNIMHNLSLKWIGSNTQPGYLRAIKHQERHKMNTLKAKTKIHCNTCGCTMHRVKTIKVYADNKADSLRESKYKVNAWMRSLEGANCRVCDSIIKGID